MPLNDNGKNACLSGGLSNAIAYVGAATGDPGTAGSVANEASGGSPAYARKAIAWNSAASGQQTNSGAITIDVAAGTYYGITFHSAATAGTYYGWFPLNGTVKGFGETDSTGVTNNTITSSGHGLADNDRVLVFNVFAESLPAGLTEGTFYHVVSSATDTFKVSTTQGGSAVDITGQGECFFQKAIPETFAAQGQITIAAGAVTLDLTGM